MARYPAPVVLAAAGVALAGCGGSNASTPTTAPPATTAPTAAGSTAPPTATAAAPSPLTPEAQSAATGDVPDNQVFLTLHNAAAGYSLKYPEGWAQEGSGSRVTIRDKNNIVRVLVEQGGVPTAASVKADIGAHIASGPQKITLSGRPALKVTYTTQSAANAVTGKKVTLVVDRYYLWRSGKRAVIDLGTPQGVDNVDAYRLMSESFRWR